MNGFIIALIDLRQKTMRGFHGIFILRRRTLPFEIPPIFSGTAALHEPQTMSCISE